MGLIGINLKKQLNLASLLFLLPFPVVAQNGPGGIGSKNGNSDLELWLRADTGVKTSNGNVGIWADSSGNKNHAKPPTKNDSPSYSSNGLNGQPTIEFDRTDDEFLDLDNALATGSNGEVTIFIVFKPEGTIDQNSSERTILANDGSNSNSGFLALGDVLSGSSDERITFGRNTSSSSEGYFYKKDINSDFLIHQFTFDGNNANYFQDNSSATLNAHNSGFSNASLEDLKRIGGNANDKAYFDGEIAEVIVYSRVLEGAEKNIVANYLDAKYQMGELQSEDYFSNSNKYKHDLIGLGFEDNDNDDHNHYFSSGGGGINLAYEHSDNLYNGDYILLAHDNNHGTIHFGQNNTNKRWARTWKLQSYSLPSNNSKGFRITFRFDEYQTNADPSTGNKEDYVLLESETEGFSNPDTVDTKKDSTILTPDSVSFYVTAGSEINKDEAFLSLGTTDPNNSPLPVELMNFKAVKKKHSVKLQWKTASETNNHYFQVQRKTNGQWENVGKVEGHGTTTKAQTYHHFDKKPGFGQNYYRLKQVDYDGSFEHSSIETVNWAKKSTGSIAIKGNPFKTKLQAFFQNIPEGTYKYQLWDVQGQVVQKGKWKISADEATKNIDMTSEQKGIYILRVAGNNAHYTEKVIKD